MQVGISKISFSGNDLGLVPHTFKIKALIIIIYCQEVGVDEAHQSMLLLEFTKGMKFEIMGWIRHFLNGNFSF